MNYRKWGIFFTDCYGESRLLFAKSCEDAVEKAKAEPDVDGAIFIVQLHGVVKPEVDTFGLPVLA